MIESLKNTASVPGAENLEDGWKKVAKASKLLPSCSRDQPLKYGIFDRFGFVSPYPSKIRHEGGRM
jgi:hypothetical protein